MYSIIHPDIIQIVNQTFIDIVCLSTRNQLILITETDAFTGWDDYNKSSRISLFPSLPWLPFWLCSGSSESFLHTTWNKFNSIKYVRQASQTNILLPSSKYEVWLLNQHKKFTVWISPNNTVRIGTEILSLNWA